MRTYRTGWLSLLVAAAFCTTLPAQTTITIDTHTEHQTIEGLGAFACMKTAKVKQGPFFVDVPMAQYYDSMVYDLGISMLRFEVSPDFWPSQASAYNTEAGVFCGPVPADVEQMREFAARGCNRFLWTVWSPPGWMKYSGEAAGPGENAPSYNSTESKLIPEHYDEFGVFLRDYLAHMRDASGGVVPYAISIANEPRFTQPFNNCVWDPPSYSNALKIVGPIIKSEFPDIRFTGTEAVFWEINNWLHPILSDPVASQYLDAVSAHYGTAANYASTWSIASGYGKTLWGTEEETDENHTGIGAAMSQARRLHWALAGGNASAWIGWVLNSFTPGDESTRAPHWIYFGAKHFFRFIRPDAIRVGTSGGGGLDVSAYKHAGHKRVTVVIVNSGSATNISLTGSAIPASFTKFQTDGSNQCANMGSVAASSSISVPGNGIVTLYSGDLTAIRRQAQRNATPAVGRRLRTAPARSYSLDGRLAAPGPRNGVRVVTDRLGARPVLMLGNGWVDR